MQPSIYPSVPPIREYFACEFLTEKGPRDRAVGIGSKEAVVQTGGEGAKQLAFANGPFRGTTEEVMPEITEGLAKVFWPISECFYDIEGLSKSKDTSQPQQELLPNSMAGS